jgi:hypothetical protein
MNESVWSIDRMIVTREHKSMWRETSASVPTTNPTWTGLGLNLGLCGERLVVKH